MDLDEESIAILSLTYLQSKKKKTSNAGKFKKRSWVRQIDVS